MANGQWSAVVRNVQKLFLGGSVAGLTEGQLVDRFVATRDEVAFSAIIARHGPMVLGVCRGILTDPNDVEDAFQATFLILVKKARTLRDRDHLGPWLYGVSRRVALRAKGNAVIRAQKERQKVHDTSESNVTLDAELRELQSLIREEVDRLSNHDRMAVVLCYLEGLTHEEAADRLGWPLGTVKGRLSRAREKLKERLTRRGITLPAIFAVHLGRTVPNIVPATLVQTTTLAATQLACGKTLTAGIVSAQVLILMEGVIGTMFATPLKIAATVIATTCVLAVPAALALQGPATITQGPSTAKPAVATPGVTKAGRQIPPETPNSGDLVVGTLEVSAEYANQALQMLDELRMKGDAVSESTYQQWSARLLAATSDPLLPKPQRLKLLRAHLKRIEALHERNHRKANGQEFTLSVLESAYLLNETHRLILQAEAEPSPPKAEVPTGLQTGGGFGGGGAFGGDAPERDPLFIEKNPGDDKQNQAILAVLGKQIPLDFSSETSLEEVKKYLISQTIDEAAGLPNGIPIYFDPEGLQNADKTMKSTIQISLQGIPLRTTLRLLLRQVGLNFRVVGGLLLISDEESIQVQERMAMMRGRRPITPEE